MKIRREGSGWSATCDSIDQRAEDIPIDSVTFDGGALTLRAAQIDASFAGRLDKDAFAGTFRQHGVERPLVLTKTATPPTVSRRPQEPVRPFPYEEIAVAVDNPSGHDRLACTLTEPRGGGPFGAVVLITGSGPQNRDEALVGHRPFLLLADAITRQGIAVLRCDDRGTAQSTGDFATATTFDFVGDTLAELAALRGRTEIDPARVGLLGHSEGAIIASMVAVRSKDVKFVVLLAAPALPGARTLDLQTTAIAKAMGGSDAQVAQAAAAQRAVFSILTTATDDAAATTMLRALGLAEAQIKVATTPWFRTFLALDPSVFLKQLAVPVLALAGERDLQVVPSANLPELREALRDKPDVTIRELPGLNHLFQTCQTGAPDEYARLEETMSPAALSIVTAWIARHATAPRPSSVP